MKRDSAEELIAKETELAELTDDSLSTVEALLKSVAGTMQECHSSNIKPLSKDAARRN